MSRTTSYTLGDHFEAYIGNLVASGRYKTASEVMTDALRLHEERTAQRQKFLSAVDEGMVGPTAPFDFDAFKARMTQKYAGNA